MRLVGALVLVGLVACGPKNNPAGSAASGSAAASGAGGASSSASAMSAAMSGAMNASSATAASSGSGMMSCGPSAGIGFWSAEIDGMAMGGSQAFFLPGPPPNVSLYNGSGQTVVQFSLGGASGPGAYTVTPSGPAGSSFQYTEPHSPLPIIYSLFPQVKPAPDDSATVTVTTWPAMKKDYAAGTFTASVSNNSAGPNGEAQNTIHKKIANGQFCAQWH